MNKQYRFKCEVCGKEEIMTSDEAYNKGWDYPPNIGMFGVLSPRTCPDCPIDKTLWWKFSRGETNNLTKEEIELINRIKNEPASMEV